MSNHLLHVFRNTPFGREMLMQSAFFCQVTGAGLVIYVPKHSQFLMYFEHGVVTVNLDQAFLRSPETARDHALEIVEAFSIRSSFYEPDQFTASLPDVPTSFGYMCCPRSISDLSTKIGLGHIGSRVRSIVQSSRFPVLIPSSAFKEWKSIVCFFGGSDNALLALRCANQLSKLCGVPIQVFTQAEQERLSYEERLRGAHLLDPIEAGHTTWLYLEEGDFRENLYTVPHDALVVVGAYGQGVAKELIFGSKMELIQTELPNPMLIVGPNC
jgi:hypothetical protein